MRRRTKVFATNKLISLSSGNFTDASTWGKLIHYNYGFGNLLNQGSVTSYSLSLTIAADILTGVAFQYTNLPINAPGQLELWLEDVTAGNTIVAGSYITIKLSDLSSIITNAIVLIHLASIKFGAPLIPGVHYTPGNTFRIAQRSTVTVVTRAGYNGNFAGLSLITSTNQEPQTGDGIFIISSHNPITYKTFNIENNLWAKNRLQGAWCPNITGASGLDLFDTSDYKNRGTLTAMSADTDWVYTDKCLSLQFNGINQFINLPNNTRLYQYDSMTISAWIYIDSIASGDRQIYAESESGGPLFLLTLSNGKLTLSKNVGSWRTVSDPDDIPTGRLVHVAGVISNGTGFVYVDGILKASGASWGAANPSTLVSQRIGASNLGQFFAGKIGEVRIYSRDLSFEEINKLSTDGVGLGLQKRAYRRGVAFTPLQTTKTNYEVVMNDTSDTVYGNFFLGSFSANFYINISEFMICDGSSLTYQNNPFTNYSLKIRNNIFVGLGGTLNIGTPSNPIDRSSSAVLELDGISRVPGQGSVLSLYVHGGTVNVYGQSRTVGKNIDRCLLNSNASVGATTLSVDADTGWLAGDNIGIGATAINSGHSANELRVLLNDASINSLDLTVGLTAAKEGSASTVQSPIILLSRNAEIRTAATPTGSTALSGNLTVYPTLALADNTSSLKADWASIKNFTSIRDYTSPDSLVFSNCVFNSVGLGIILLTANSGFKVQDCVSYGSTLIGTHTVASSSESLIDNCYILGSYEGTTAGVITTSYFNYTINNLRACGQNALLSIFHAIGATWDPTPATPAGSLSNIYIHSSIRGLSLYINNDRSNPTTVTDVTMHRIQNDGIVIAGNGFIVDNFRAWQCSGSGVYVIAGTKDIVLRNGQIARESGTMTYGLRNRVDQNTTSSPEYILDNVVFGTGFPGALSLTTSDIFLDSNTTVRLKMKNCLLTHPTSQISGVPYSGNDYIISENHNQVQGNKLIRKRFGTITNDNTIFYNSAPSIRMAPSNSFAPLSHIVARFAVKKDELHSITIRIRKSTASDGSNYNGSQPRLTLLENPLIGVNTDTILSTASSANGTWELITVTLPAATRDGIAMLSVECDGTAGWINVDSITLPVVNTLDLTRGDDISRVISYGNNYGGRLIGGATLID